MIKIYHILSCYAERWNKSKTLFLILIAGITAIQYLLNVFTPYALDDLHMEYYYDSSVPLHSIGEVWDTQLLNYSGHTGRFLSHYLWQLIYYLENGDKLAFNILNTAVFTGMILLMYVFAVGKRGINNFLLLLTYTLIMTCVEGFGQSILWMAGALTYLWMIVLALVFLLPFRLQLSRNIPLAYSILYFYFAIVAGNGVENVSLGISIALVSYLAFKRYRKEKIYNWQYLGAVGFLIGTVILIVAPGNFVRYSQSYGDQTIFSLIPNAIALTKIFMNKDCLFVPLLLSAMFFCYAQYSKRILTFMLIALFFVTYSMAGVSYFPERTRLASVVIAVIICGYLFAHQEATAIKKQILPGIIILIITCSTACFDALRTTREVSNYYAYVNKTIADAKAAGKNMVYIKGYVGRDRFSISGNKMAIFSKDYRCWTNADLAFKKGIKAIYVTDFMVDDYTGGELPDPQFRQ